MLQYVNDTFLTIKGQCDLVSILYDFKLGFGLEINENKHNILARILKKRLKGSYKLHGQNGFSL
jgi:hypothetical protein